MPGTILGIDFGSTGLRAAYVADGTPVVLPPAGAPATRWLLCEPVRGRPPAVGFPSLKSKLGVARTVSPDGAPRSPVELVAEALAALRRMAEQQAAVAIEAAVIAVPAHYTASQRAALREATGRAGFADCRLVNDTMAALIAHTGRHEPASTALVCGVGYGGFELGLVRSLRGRFRALGYEGGTAPAGWLFDRLVLEVLFATLAEQGQALDTDGFDAGCWLRLRELAEALKERLGREDEALFPAPIETDDGARLSLAFRRNVFEALIEPHIAAMFGQIEQLLAQAGLPRGDIDRVLLVGGTMRLPLLQTRLAAATGKAPLLTDAYDLARGAALVAVQLAGEPAVEAVPPAEARPAATGGAHDPALRAALVPAPNDRARSAPLVLRARRPTAARPAAAGEPSLERAERLMREGKSEEARALLQELVTRARALLDRLPGAPAVPVLSAAPKTSAAPHGPERDASAGPTRASDSEAARRALRLAERRLAQRRYEEAVGQSHLAWHEDPSNPKVLEAMIDVHCRAAAANPGPGRYQDAIRWLGCAYGHDQTNMEVRKLLADRHYHHAKYLHENSQPERVRAALDEALRWDPDHDAANALDAALRRR